MAVFCGRIDGGVEYDFIIKIACTVYSFYFYMYTCHLPYASMCYCQWFPYGMFLKHLTLRDHAIVHFPREDWVVALDLLNGKS